MSQSADDPAVFLVVPAASLTAYIPDELTCPCWKGTVPIHISR